MAKILRRIGFTKGLPEELAARLQVSNLVDDATTPDGSTAFDDTALSANATKTALSAKVDTSSIVNDLTTGGTTVPLSAQQGVELKQLIDGMANGLSYKGAFDASVETSFPSDTIQGDFYKVSGDGTVDGLELKVGDMIIANADVVGATSASDWDKIDNTESADLLRDGDVSTDSDFTVDPTKLTDRATIKALVEAASAAITPKVINETVTLSGDTATLSHEPANGVIFMGYVQVNNGDGTFDLVAASVSGNTLTVLPETTGEYTGKQTIVSYMYF
jgi:hypothetical protein